MTSCLVQWLACLTAIQEVPGSIPGYTLEIFLEVQSLERGPPSLVRTIGQLLDMRSSEIQLRKLKLRLRDKRFANHKAPCTVIWQQPLQLVQALQGCSATELDNGKKFLIRPRLYQGCSTRDDDDDELCQVKNGMHYVTLVAGAVSGKGGNAFDFI